ncbi:hypothetical protein ACTQ5X_02735 [Jeotgalibaca porci]|uniref:hypothetical protein n=1 Tax=Jeotgalibaca porci TaxID=1868793 RepID=UPI003F8DEDE0
MAKTYSKNYGVWKNDSFLMQGTADQIGDRLNIKPRTVYTYATHKKRKEQMEKRNGLIIDRLE